MRLLFPSRLSAAAFAAVMAMAVLAWGVVSSPVLLGYMGGGDAPGGGGKGYGYRDDKSRQERWDKFQKNRVDRLAEILSLTPEQKEKVSAIMEDGRKQIDAERQKMKKRVDELRNATDQKIESILNEEQKKKFRAHKEEMERKMKERCEKGGMWWQKKSGKSDEMTPPPNAE